MFPSQRTGEALGSSPFSLQWPCAISEVKVPSNPSLVNEVRSTRSKSQVKRLLPSYKAFVSNLDSVQIPTTIQEALKVPAWKQAVEDEIRALESNGTWTLTELPYGKKPVGELIELKKLLAAEFEIKDLGALRYFLGMEVARSKEGIVISQRKYILDLLKETGMLGRKPADTPMDPNRRTKRMRKRLVGKLIYLSHTRPDIAFSVSVVSQQVNNPTEDHLEAVNRILRYLKMTPGHGLLFKKCENHEIEIYTDASWAGELTERRSTTGYCSYVWGNLVTWRSKKQPVVSRSSAESEYRALALGICEGIWLQRLLRELRVEAKSAVKMFCDSQAAIDISKNPVHHDRTKHVGID
ncbi:hypothetical protein UlMin_016512 [Ulmus minor]